jgi:hypothetical protein
MSELAEGARLEIACAAKGGTEGSNPSLSAIIPIKTTACLVFRLHQKSYHQEIALIYHCPYQTFMNSLEVSIHPRA